VNLTLVVISINFNMYCIYSCRILYICDGYIALELWYMD